MTSCADVIDFLPLHSDQSIWLSNTVSARLRKQRNSGCSIATPFVTWFCRRVLRKLHWGLKGNREASDNLINTFNIFRGPPHYYPSRTVYFSSAIGVLNFVSVVSQKNIKSDLVRIISWSLEMFIFSLLTGLLSTYYSFFPNKNKFFLLHVIGWQKNACNEIRLFVLELVTWVSFCHQLIESWTRYNATDFFISPWGLRSFSQDHKIP